MTGRTAGLGWQPLEDGSRRQDGEKWGGGSPQEGDPDVLKPDPMRRFKDGKKAAAGHAARRLICLALMLWLGAAGAFGQDDTTTEIWPEIDTWLRLSPAWRLSMFVPISKNIETAYREGNLILQADYAFGKMRRPEKRRLVDESRAQEMKRFLVRGGYLGGMSLDDRGDVVQGICGAYSNFT